MFNFYIEYAYGGHPFPFTGVFDIAPKDAEDLGEQFKFKYVYIRKQFTSFRYCCLFHGLKHCTFVYIKIKIIFFYRESIVIGHTDFTSSEINIILEELGKQYRGDHYHLLNKNCNNFTSSLLKVLLKYCVTFIQVHNIYMCVCEFVFYRHYVEKNYLVGSTG